LSITNSIKNLLDIQDENITFEKNCVEKGEFKGKPCKYITATLSYVPTHCKQCGIKNENNTVYKNGTQTSRITLPISGMHPTYLLLRKQRFFCKACERSFTAQTPLVKKHCFISEEIALKRYVHTLNSSLLSSYIRTGIRTLKTFLSYIKNNFHYHHNNGRVEGIHNKNKGS